MGGPLEDLDIFQSGDLRIYHGRGRRVVTLKHRISEPPGTTGLWWLVTDLAADYDFHCAQAHVGRKVTEMEALAWLAKET